jgi:hypothetical protein
VNVERTKTFCDRAMLGAIEGLVANDQYVMGEQGIS